MDKYTRNYVLSVETKTGNTLIIKPPFTIDFDIQRNTLSSVNIGKIRIYNLAEDTRNDIRKNSWDYDDIRQVTLNAGYGTNMPIIFTGFIQQSSSVREGTNFITTIQSFDGGEAFSNGTLNSAFPSGTPMKTVLQSVVTALPGVSLGAIGNYPGNLQRGNSFSGSATEVLDDLTGGGFFIDNGKGYCLGDSECLAGEIVVINSDTGLLGTPTLEETLLHFDIIFEPRIHVAQQIKLQSITGANYNSFFIVKSLHHKGIISESISGEAITTIGVFANESITVVEP